MKPRKHINKNLKNETMEYSQADTHRGWFDSN